MADSSALGGTDVLASERIAGVVRNRVPHREHIVAAVVQVGGGRPAYLWAITEHADVMAVERANRAFTNWPRPVLTTAAGMSCRRPAGFAP